MQPIPMVGYRNSWMRGAPGRGDLRVAGLGLLLGGRNLAGPVVGGQVALPGSVRKSVIWRHSLHLDGERRIRTERLCVGEDGGIDLAVGAGVAMDPTMAGRNAPRESNALVDLRRLRPSVRRSARPAQQGRRVRQDRRDRRGGAADRAMVAAANGSVSRTG